MMSSIPASLPPAATEMNQSLATETSCLQPDDKTLIEISNPFPPSQLDESRYVDFVRDPSAGGLSTFIGTTRETFNGRRVLELRYEAYTSMALRQLATLCASARATWQLKKVSVAHRLGVVPVGEASVLVAVSAEHRGPAMDACRFLIDGLKASVPIWKKEVYEDGEVWKENKEFFESGVPADDTEQQSCCGHKVRVIANEEDAEKKKRS